MRSMLVALCLLVAALVSGQGQSAQSLFLTTRVDATIVVTPSQNGMQNVAVTILKPTYSHALLQEQIVRLGKELGFEPRGLQVYAYSFNQADPTASQVRASFGISGLVGSEPGIFLVEPIARAFALESPPDSLDALMIEYPKAVPTDRTLKSCAPPAPGCAGVILEGRNETAVGGIEYRLKYLSHDPAQISVPDKPKSSPPAAPSAPPRPSTDWGLIGLIVVAATAVGALVYSLLLRGRPAGPRGKSSSGRTDGNSKGSSNQSPRGRT